MFKRQSQTFSSDLSIHSVVKSYSDLPRTKLTTANTIIPKSDSNACTYIIYYFGCVQSISKTKAV